MHLRRIPPNREVEIGLRLTVSVADPLKIGTFVKHSQGIELLSWSTNASLLLKHLWTLLESLIDVLPASWFNKSTAGKEARLTFTTTKLERTFDITL